MIAVEVSFDMGDIRTVELYKDIPKKVHGSREPRHLGCQEIKESLNRTDVQTFGKLDPRILVESASNQLHVNAIKAAAIAHEHIVNFRPRA
jgi:hypothetical protein